MRPGTSPPIRTRYSSRSTRVLLACSGLLFTVTGVVAGAPTAAAAISCTFNGQASVVTGVNPGAVISISCTGMPPKLSVFLVETSALSGLVSSANQTSEADVGALQSAKSNASGNLAAPFNVPSPYTDADPNGVCPPTQAEVNAGEVGCLLSVATASGTNYGTATLQYVGQPTPQTPALLVSPTSACPGQQVTFTGGGGWWGNAGSVTPITSADVSVGGIAPDTTSASISAASYNYSPPSPLVSPTLSGNFVIPSGVAPGSQNLTVTEPNTTVLAGTVSASVPITISGGATGCNEPQTITFTSVAPSAAVFDGPTYTVSATASSGLLVTLGVDSSASSVCSLVGSTVSFIGVGTCTIDADQAGNLTYAAAPEVQQSFIVNPATPSTPTITNIPDSGVAIYGESFVPSVSTTGDGTTSVTSSTLSICTVSDTGTVDFVGVGTCTLTAAVAAGIDYIGAVGTPQSFSVNPEVQAIISPNSATAMSHSYFRFTVMTIGDSIPLITERGKLPKDIGFINEDNGTATIAGTPRAKKTTVYHFMITATFGSGTSRYIVIQAFTLTVNPA
jgi:hypothetical protein